MLLREILKLRSSEVARNMYFSICFASSKFSKRASKLHEKEHFARDLKSGGGGHEPTVPPRFLRPWSRGSERSYGNTRIDSNFLFYCADM